MLPSFLPNSACPHDPSPTPKGPKSFSLPTMASYGIPGDVSPELGPSDPWPLPQIESSRAKGWKSQIRGSEPDLLPSPLCPSVVSHCIVA